MACMTVRPLPPKGHCHHHRPVISFKEQLQVNCKQLAVSSTLITVPTSALGISQLLTAYRSLLTPRFPIAQSPLRLPRYKDQRASAAGTCPAPKLPDSSSNQAPRRRRRPPHSFSAADGSK